MVNKVFISYRQGESNIVADQLYQFFSEYSDAHKGDYEPFIDRADTLGGDDWWRAICTNIQARSHFVPLLCREYFESPFCLEELHFANRCRSVIIPLRVDNMDMAEIEARLRTFSTQAGNTLQNIHIIDCNTLDDTRQKEILNAVKRNAPHTFPDRAGIPFPPCPINPIQALKEISDELDKEQLDDVDQIITKFRTMTQFVGHRENILSLVERLKSEKASHLSYSQHYELDRLRRRLVTVYPPYGQAIINAAHELEIAAIYSHRHDAANEILNSISSSYKRPTEICLMGVSLNNFERIDGEFHQSWEEIRKLVASATPDSPQLDIKILIAHPYSFGSVLRSKRENPNMPLPRRRLTTEVHLTAEEINRMQERLSEKGNIPIRLEARLYITAPILFLCWTNRKSFMQQYYYWNQHEGARMPVLSFDAENMAGNGYNLHKDLHNHFQWIWDNASVLVSDFLAGHQHGVDTALHEAGVVNVYTSNADAKARILYLLRNAKKRVWIQGITLYSYFSKDDQLTHAFADVVTRQRSDNASDEHEAIALSSSESDQEIEEIETQGEGRGNLDVRVLLLDPDCEQAKYRAYREYLIIQERLRAKAVSYDEYIQQDLHRNTRLFLEARFTRLSLDVLQQGTQNPNFQQRLFKSAPYSFMLIADDHVMVEQYHYGNEPVGAGNNILQDTILGKDMPKIEYGPDVPDIFLASGKSGKGAATLNQLLEDHFNFAWQTAHDPHKQD